MAEINMFRSSSNARSLEPGEVLFREGDPGDVMFAVIEGDIELVRKGAIVGVIGAGGVVGELALIDDAPRSADAQARTAARVVPVDQREFTFLVQEHPTFALQVMSVMAERLRKANEELSGMDR